MAYGQFKSLDDFFNDISFQLWTKDYRARLMLTSRQFRSAVNVKVIFNWTYSGSVEKFYTDGFSYDHDDRPGADELRTVDSELKYAELNLVKRGVVSAQSPDCKGLVLQVVNSFPNGLAAELLNVAECKLVQYGKELSARKLLEVAKRHGRNEREIYENICAYFSKGNYY